jgi:uncharacterized protein GlcG (DUF336 family)
MFSRRSALTLLLSLGLAGPVQAEDVVSLKTVGMALARDLADAAVLACREKGYQVSAVVVDRSAQVRAVLRDDLAAHFTIQIAEEKANAVVMSGVSSAAFRDNRGDIREEMNHVRGILVLAGGVPIEAGGFRLGALGVSGAPGGDLDEACANAALDALAERIEFAGT